MTEVVFPEQTADEALRFAVIAARHCGQWVLCRHRARDTWELPGGHREAGETITETARRELWEETGATAAELRPICAYGVRTGTDAPLSCGMLFFAEVEQLGSLPPFEIVELRLTKTLPERWTYPEIQPALLKRVQQFLPGC